MVMNRSRIAFTLSAVLLVLWSVPADAQRQRPRARQRIGAVQQPVSKKQNGSKQRLRAKKQRPGARQQPISEQPPAPEPTVSVQPPVPEPTVSEQPPTPEPQRTGDTLNAREDRPWAKGISKEDQALVVELFQAGNSLLKESIFVQATEKYRKALEHWDHPAIHYNLALALMNLDQPIEVHEHLVAALRYGPEPLENEKFEYARNYKTLIEKQLARVEIICDLPGATVTLDGKTLFVGPGRHEGLVRIGTHSIIAHKAGYLPTEKSRTLMSGEQMTLDLKLYTSDQVTQYRRRWPAWTPWVVMGSGLAVAAGGGLLHMETSKSYSAFDAGITERCLSGCERAPDDLMTMKARGDLTQKAAMGAYSLGGAALLTGAVLLYLNQPQAYRIDPDQGEATVDVTPLLGGDTNGVLATLRF